MLGSISPVHHCTVEGALKPLLEAKGRPRHQNVKDLEDLDPARCQRPDTWCRHVEIARHCMKHHETFYALLCVYECSLVFLRLILIMADLESYRDTFLFSFEAAPIAVRAVAANCPAEMLC